MLLLYYNLDQIYPTQTVTILNRGSKLQWHSAFAALNGTAVDCT